jgi:hypothetical protein
MSIANADALGRPRPSIRTLGHTTPHEIYGYYLRITPNPNKSRISASAFVRVHTMNQNAYPAVSEDVLAALPTRAARD